METITPGADVSEKTGLVWSTPILTIYKQKRYQDENYIKNFIKILGKTIITS